MSAYFPDRETTHTVLSLATRAPSIHDSEPWRWRVGAQSLHLYTDHDTNPESRHVLLSCGAALHHCVVALAALGWRAKVQRLPDEAEPEHLAALEVYRHPASDLDVMMAAAIPKRRTDWRHFSSWSVSVADIALIEARAANVGVTMRRVKSLPEVEHVVAQAVWRQAADYGHENESASRSRGSASSADAPPQNTQRSGPTGSLVAPLFGDGTIAPWLTTEPATDNAVVLALGTNDDSRLARLRAGEAMSLVLLSATALGLASCPVAEPLETAEARDVMQTSLFDVVGIPQMLMRIGWAPVDADPLPSTPRRPLADVSEWLDRQSLTCVVNR